MPSNIDMVVIAVQILFPFVLGAVAYGYKRLVEMLPSAQQERVKSLVRSVCMAVEQRCSAMDGPAKKTEAVRMIDQLLGHMGIHVPPALIDTLIEQAVYAINQGASQDPQATNIVPAVVPQK